MGKSDKNKKYSKFLTGISGSTSNSGNGGKSKTGASSLDNNIAYDVDSASKSSYSGIFLDLTSLEEAKRFKACSLVCNIFSNVESATISKSVLDKFATVDVLNKLSIRLMDTSDRIKLIAAATFRNIAATGNLEVSNNMLGAGIVNTVVTMITSLLSGTCGFSLAVVISKASYLEQLVATLCNVSAATSELNQILKSIFPLIPLLLQLVLTDIPVTGVDGAALTSSDVLKLLNLRTVVWKTLLVWSDESSDFAQYLTLSTDVSLTDADYRSQLVLVVLREAVTMQSLARQPGVSAPVAAAHTALIQTLSQYHQGMGGSLLLNMITSSGSDGGGSSPPDALTRSWCVVAQAVVRTHPTVCPTLVSTGVPPAPALLLSVLIAKLSWVGTWHIQSAQLEILRQLKSAMVDEAVSAQSQNQDENQSQGTSSGVWEQAYLASQAACQLSMESIANLVISPLFQHCLAMRTDLLADEVGPDLSGMLRECMDDDSGSAQSPVCAASSTKLASPSPSMASVSSPAPRSGSGAELSLSAQVLDNYTAQLASLHGEHVGQAMLLLLSPASVSGGTGATAVQYKVPLDRVLHLITGQLQHYEHLLTGIMNILSIVAQCIAPSTGGSPDKFLIMLSESMTDPSAAAAISTPRISRLVELVVSVYVGIGMSLTDLWGFLGRGKDSQAPPMTHNSNSITGFILSSEAAAPAGVVALPSVQESSMQLSDMLASGIDGGQETGGPDASATIDATSKGQKDKDVEQGDKSEVDFSELRAVLIAACVGATNVVDVCLQCLHTGTFAGEIYGNLCSQVNGQQGGLLKGIMGLVPPIPSDGVRAPQAGRSVELLQGSAAVLSSLCALSLTLAGSGSGLVLLSNNYILVLTNMLLKKLQQLHTDYITAVGVPTTVSPRVLDTLSVKYCHLLGVAHLVNTVIDLHSSDDEALLGGYRKFGVQAALTSLNTACKAQWKDLAEHCRLQGISAVDYEGICPQDGFIKGVIINLREFLKYKKSFL